MLALYVYIRRSFGQRSSANGLRSTGARKERKIPCDAVCKLLDWFRKQRPGHGSFSQVCPLHFGLLVPNTTKCRRRRWTLDGVSTQRNAKEPPMAQQQQQHRAEEKKTVIDPSLSLR
jgi:hypothetical protein